MVSMWWGYCQQEALQLLMQVAREVGEDFWTGGCVWYPTDGLEAQVPHGASSGISGLMAFTLELGLCQTSQQRQAAQLVYKNIMYVKWADSDTSRYSQH